MDEKIIDELNLRLKGPIIAFEKILKGRTLPRIFAEAALEELLQVRKLLDQFYCSKNFTPHKD